MVLPDSGTSSASIPSSNTSAIKMAAAKPSLLADSAGIINVQRPRKEIRTRGINNVIM